MLFQPDTKVSFPTSETTADVDTSLETTTLNADMSFPTFETTTTTTTTDLESLYDDWRESFDWTVNHVMAVFGFLAVNVLPITVCLVCLSRHCKRYLPSYLNFYFVGAVLMLSAFTLTVYILLTVDFGDQLILRDYVASLVITEFFVAIGCLLGICRQNHHHEDERSRNNNNNNNNNNELPLPSYDEALKSKDYPKKKSKKSKGKRSDVEKGDGDASSISSFSSSVVSEEEEELPSFGQAVHM